MRAWVVGEGISGSYSFENVFATSDSPPGFSPVESRLVLFSLNVVSVAVETACRFGTENCEGVCWCEDFGACSPVLCRHVSSESRSLHFDGVLRDVGERAELISSDALPTSAQSLCHCPVLSAYHEFEWFLWGRPHPLQRVHQRSFNELRV